MNLRSCGPDDLAPEHVDGGPPLTSAASVVAEPAAGPLRAATPQAAATAAWRVLLHDGSTMTVVADGFEIGAGGALVLWRRLESHGRQTVCAFSFDAWQRIEEGAA